MITDRSGWPEQSEVFEQILCVEFGLAKPLSQHGKLLDSLKTLANALCPSFHGKHDVHRQIDRTKPVLLELDWAPLAYSTGSRNRVRMNPAHITLFRNAILLQGVFGEPKIVVEFLSSKELSQLRKEYAHWARELFLNRQSLAGLGLLRQELLSFLELLPAADLRTSRLPNPFVDALPQMGLGPHKGNLLKTLAAQTAAISLGDGMMIHYLNQDLEQAYACAVELDTDNPLLQKYRALILREYQQAKDFDDLLDSFR